MSIRYEFLDEREVRKTVDNKVPPMPEITLFNVGDTIIDENKVPVTVDGIHCAQYIVTDTVTPPHPAHPDWSDTPPTEYTFK
jgi:hypothetical protein